MVEKIIKYKAVSAACCAAVAMALGGFLWAYAGVRNAGGGPVTVHFNDMNGITEIGNIGSVVSIGILGVIITVLNFFIAIELEEREHFGGKVVAAESVLFAVLLFIAFAAILGAN